MNESVKKADKYHTSVLLQEAVDWLAVKPGRWYLDATVGGGGHSAEILKRGGRVLGIDQDREALAAAKEHLSRACPDAPWQLKQGNFAQLASLAAKAEAGPIFGVLFDLGVSGWQFGGHGRGFSFQQDEALDMRMDRETQQVTAKDLLAALSEKELDEIFREFGGEELARPIARRLVRTRDRGPIVTTGQLRDLVAQVYGRFGRRRGRLNPATKVFQALRIAVNSELENLERGLAEAWQVLEPNGRIVVISFHEGEDRIVKNQFRQWQESQEGRILTSKPVVPKPEEIAANPRARSAKLRAGEKQR
jgi:16S rRNA (cytosine1402-N4)-methyltransferase